MHKISKAALVACYILMIVAGFFYYPRWGKYGSEATLSWDVSGYYMYLPAVFIYKDVKKLGFHEEILKKYKPTPDFQQAFVHQKTGNYVLKYSSGQSILMSPFFLVAHFVASLSGKYPADGFSYPYQLAIGIGMFVYALIGLYVLRKILLRYFPDGAVAMTLIALVVGSNYLNYAVIDQAMTHSTLFTLYAILILCTIKFYEAPSKRLSIFIGALVGLATLIRPTEIISVLIPLFWGISGWKGFKERFSFFAARPGYLLLSGFFAGCFIAIQLLYWRYVAHEWIVYSYEDQGFSWAAPHFYDYIIGYRSGWLRYCPVMILPFIGAIILLRSQGKLWIAVVFMLLNLYIVSSWDIWWFGGRAMVQSYAVMAFPMAALFSYVQKRLSLKLIFYPALLLFAYLNIWWTHNSHYGNISLSNPSKEYYERVVGRWKVAKEVSRYLDGNEWFEGKPVNETLLYFNDFSADTIANTIDNGSDGKAVYVDEKYQWVPEYNAKLPPANAKWLRASADLKAIVTEGDEWKICQFCIKLYNNDSLVKSNFFRTHRIMRDGRQKNVYVDMKIPDKPFTRVAVTFWNAGGANKTIIDNLKVISFN